MRAKVANVGAASTSVGLNIQRGKTKILNQNTENTDTVTLDGDILEQVELFTYLGGNIDEQGEYDADLNARIGKAKTTFPRLKNIWNSKNCRSESKSESSIRTSRQFHCTEVKLEELQQPSS
ncbi:unnamed protein product [Schistosoma mattheei]|uniref:Uncharacterized protein n=1 Tax=Schistosoma mattheei TaxID=31246 RepID=A0A183NPF2_9TREM|nr:unnamed protein product [Schistosoma mattheei]